MHSLPLKNSYCQEMMKTFLVMSMETSLKFLDVVVMSTSCIYNTISG